MMIGAAKESLIYAQLAGGCINNQKERNMFLDEELKQIYEKGKSDGKSTREIAQLLLQCCTKYVERPDENGPQAFLASLRKIDYSWQLFFKNRKEFEPMGLRGAILDSVSDDNVRSTMRVLLRW